MSARVRFSHPEPNVCFNQCMASRGRKTNVPKSPEARNNARLRKISYVKNNRLRRKLSNKLGWIVKRYGLLARRHFLDHPVCFMCGELRLSCLAIHHTHGKQVNKFTTLCHNCHAAHHGGDYTLADCIENGPLQKRGKQLSMPASTTS